VSGTFRLYEPEHREVDGLDDGAVITTYVDLYTLHFRGYKLCQFRSRTRSNCWIYKGIYGNLGEHGEGTTVGIL
jgi:hypothetical protein